MSSVAEIFSDAPTLAEDPDAIAETVEKEIPSSPLVVLEEAGGEEELTTEGQAKKRGHDQVDSGSEDSQPETKR